MDRPATCLANMPDKQAAAFIAIESLGQRASYLERALDTWTLSRSVQKGRQRGAVGVRKKKLELKGAAEAQQFFQEGCPENQLTLSPHQQAQARPFHWSGRVRAAVDGSEANVCLQWEAGWGPYRRF